MSSEEEPIDDVDDIQIIEEGEEVEAIENQENVEETNENAENAEGETKIVVKPKRVVRNPQPKLNEQTLKGPKGLAAIESYFERVKFKGRGYEEQDLNVLMKTYEYWCHRLFPKFPFDDCIARLEKLGTKKATQTHIKRIRLDINFDGDKPLLSDEGENDTAGFVDTYDDQFDQLLPTASSEPVVEMTDEQLERMRQNKERAQRLREERLRKIREKAVDNLGGSNHTLTQNSQELITRDNHETENIEATSTSMNSGYTQNDSGKTKENENRLENRLQRDSEDASDTLELEERNKAKRKKRVIESDSEDEITENNLSQANQITQSSQESTNRSNTCEDKEHSQVNRSHETEIFDAYSASGDGNCSQNGGFVSALQVSEDDMDTLELEERNKAKKKRVIESDSEDEITENNQSGQESTNIYNRSNTREDRNEHEHTQINAQASHEADIFYADNTSGNGNCSQNVKTNPRQNDVAVSTPSQDSEDDMEPLELEEEDTTKKKKQTIESDIEDEIVNDENEEETVEKDAKRNSEIVEPNGLVTNAKVDNGAADSNNVYFQNKKPILDAHEETEENDIEDILNEINADDTEIDNEWTT